MGVFVYSDAAGVAPTSPNADMAFQRLTKKMISIHAAKGGGMCCSPNTGRIVFARGTGGGSGGSAEGAAKEGGGSSKSGSGGDTEAEAAGDAPGEPEAGGAEPKGSRAGNVGTVSWFWSVCVTAEGKACATLQFVLPARIAAVETAVAASKTLRELVESVITATAPRAGAAANEIAAAAERQVCSLCDADAANGSLSLVPILAARLSSDIAVNIRTHARTHARTACKL